MIFIHNYNVRTIILQTKPTDSKAERIQAKFNEQVKNASEPQPSTSGYNKSANSSHNEKRGKSGSPIKQLKWDKSILDCLVRHTCI